MKAGDVASAGRGVKMRQGVSSEATNTDKMRALGA